MPAPLRVEEFEIIRAMVYQQTGINLSTPKIAMIQSRLTKRLKEIGCQDFKKYIKLTTLDHRERAVMFNLITTNVTKFFRENHHFEFINSVLPDYLANKPKKVINVWSAACSTGQEPYSIAITLNEYFKDHPGEFHIIASDINTEVLKKASEGIYPWEEVNEIPYNLLTKYFKLGSGTNKGLFKIKEHLQRKVSFRQINLVDANVDYPVEGLYDFIFCRNVFIYFDMETKRRAVRKMYRKLNNGGFLLLGHSESLNVYENSDGNWVSREHTVYQKQEGVGRGV